MLSHVKCPIIAIRGVLIWLVEGDGLGKWIRQLLVTLTMYFLSNAMIINQEFSYSLLRFLFLSKVSKP